MVVFSPGLGLPWEGRLLLELVTFGHVNGEKQTG